MLGESGSMSYWSSLQRSLTDRADALMEYTETLLADSDRSDDGFTRALKMCRLYTRVFVETLEREIAEAESEDERRELAEGHLEAFAERYEKIDRWLSRGSQGSVPRALQTICRRQFDAASLPGHEPVLTVGAPDSFEAARTPDLHKQLFEGLTIYGEERDQEVAALKQERALAIISVPYLEGTRTLWYPITVGHEICHLRLAENEVARRELADVASRWVKASPDEYQAALEQMEKEGIPELTREAKLINTFRLWAIEIVCDLNAVRLFGPAGARAIAEFVSMGEDVVVEESYESTHPPSPLRLKIMLRYLEKLGFPTDELGDQVRAWPGRMVTASRDPVTMLLITALGKAADDLIEIPASWGFQLKSDPEFDDMVSGCVEALLDGAPCGTHLWLEGKGWVSTTTAHVVNAAWHAREKLAAGLAKQEADQEGALLRPNKLPTGGERLQLDRLASKAIDSIELARFWRKSSEIIAPEEVKPKEGLAEGGEAQGGVLSGLKIAERLEIVDQADPRRLLVTPLFSDAVCEAGIDLRLGPDFIVFRHSATRAFNPLSKAQDPRMVQKRVTKAWGEEFVLHPNELVLAATLEYIVIPSDLSAQVITRSSYGRLGLMTATAVQVQPGSRGCITLELKNQSETPIVLTPGARVAQLILWTVVAPAKPRAAKYWFPTGPEFSKAHDDPEAGELAELGQRIRERHEGTAPQLEVSFSGSKGHCEYFADTAARVIVPFVEGDDPNEPARCRFSAASPQLAHVLQRWGDADNHGTVVQQKGPQTFEIRSTESIGSGMVQLESPSIDEPLLLRSRDPETVAAAIDELVVDPDRVDPSMLPV